MNKILVTVKEIRHNITYDYDYETQHTYCVWNDEELYHKIHDTATDGHYSVVKYEVLKIEKDA